MLGKINTTLISKELLDKQFLYLSHLLTEQLNTEGFWTGRLASSALATSVAMVPLKLHKNIGFGKKIELGLSWLFANVNNDGGFGDTPESKSNVSTSLLCYAAINYCCNDDTSRKNALSGIKNYLETQQISFDSNNLTSSVLKFYGRDYTFSVPILSMLVICGVLNEEACNRLPQLPFEFTLLPASWYRFFKLEVVSYAIPALVAVGIFIFRKRTKGNLLFRFIRQKSIDPALKKLTEMIPESGGFLEAIPLTAFVCMALMAGDSDCPAVIKKGMIFLVKQQRPDGSWPIDTDLSTWVTTLGIKALGPKLYQSLSVESVESLKVHVLNIQYKEKHPFNGAKPGGWGWTNYTGSVPDADDTSGAILALLQMYTGKNEETEAIINGCNWLLGLQNSDGGFPTFCKGWGRLPFDSSSADLTGHAFAAFILTLEKLGDKLTPKVYKSFFKSAVKASGFLRKAQHSSGYWLPLWFGNQHTIDQTNPVYGTAKVSIYLDDCIVCKCLSESLRSVLEHMLDKARIYLVTQQNNDGSWGGAIDSKPSIEETSLAIGALVSGNESACIKGLNWLDNETKNHKFTSAPIGLYFAALWYDEEMYPLIYYIETLRRFLNK